MLISASVVTHFLRTGRLPSRATDAPFLLVRRLPAAASACWKDSPRG